MNDMDSIEDIELDALIDCIYRHCGYDFRHYARASLRRNIEAQISREGLAHISQLIPLILRDNALLQRILCRLSITVTEFFRDPLFFKYLSQDVFPVLKTFPFFKIWHAGCASGEEVYSLAILLQEAGLLSRARIYATDFNHQVLAKAKQAIYAREQIDQFNEPYRQAGGQHKLSDYFHCQYDVARLNSALKQQIIFAHHNLVTDGVFGEMQIIICRNVLIYFDKELKKRVIRLFSDSLCHGGLLCLGSKESLEYLKVADTFNVQNRERCIYKKVAQVTQPDSEHCNDDYVFE